MTSSSPAWTDSRASPRLSRRSFQRRKCNYASCIYRASTREEAELKLSEFAARWDEQFPTISKSWRANWERVPPFFAYPADIRKVIYTTNAIESVNMSLRKIIKNRGSFPTDEAALKLLYLALQNISRKWTMPIKQWKAALNRFAILFEDRMPAL
jgi:putative transposase